MQRPYRKQLLLSLLSLCCINPVFAANNIPAQTGGGTTNAIAFAVQAGQIAGSAQGCGINISTFTTRVSEAINKLALNPTDATAATSTFQQTLQQAQITQRNNNPIPCSQVMQDFNNLPLLRPDYEQTVIAQLTPGTIDNNQSSNAQQNNMGNMSAPNQQQNLNNQAMPNTGNMNAANSNNLNSGMSNQNMAGGNNQQQNVVANPAYPQQNYGPTKSIGTNFPGAVQPYGMANLPNNNLQQNQTANTGQQTNNPPPPNFNNPNNNPPANNNYSSQ